MSAETNSRHVARHDDTVAIERVLEGPPPRHPAPPRRQPGDLWRTIARGIGQTLVTLGLVVLLFVVHEVYVTDLFADRRQEAVADELRDTWSRGPVADDDAAAPLAQVPLGDGFAFLRIPRLGEDYVRAIVEGTGAEELAEGPGHYVGTAMPGEPGNLAIAGHRVGTGSPFLELDRMQPGDAIVVETADAWFTYRVLGDPATGDVVGPEGIPGQHIVAPTDVSVIAPTPGSTDATVTGSYLTLTTCHPRYSARQRLIVHAVLEGGALSKADAPDGPPALTGA